MLLDFLKAVYESHNLEEVWDLHCRTMAEYGFPRLIYGNTHYTTPNSPTGPREDSLFLSNHDPGYFKRFIEDGLYAHAPMIRWARDCTGSCSWSYVRSIMDDLTAAERAVLEVNREFGVTAGYTICFAEGTTRAKGVISLAGPAGAEQGEIDRIWDHHGREIEAMNNVVHLKILSLPHDKVMPRLSDRQREVLEWIGDGKTNQDIATILGVKTATVEKHLRLAREKLGVETTAQAVLKATFLNQIYTF
ncbi:LuxR family transcriptional regulator [Aliiroseovarius sp.]|uniref:LuxR family transcriptional regulator n=1 Tax=Aliiroseovarius sp. TaxID=1872442 RepID=UPI0026331099|nr:LuxR family transcriptional regulator [Aliiroseovarius sp.]